MVRPKYNQLRENAFIYCSPKDFNTIILTELDKRYIPPYLEKHKVLQLAEIYIFQHRELFTRSANEIITARYIATLIQMAIDNYINEEQGGKI